MPILDEVKDLLNAEEPVAIRTVDFRGRVIDIDDSGLATIKPANGEPILPTPLNLDADFELIQGRMGDWILRQNGTGREKAGAEIMTLRHEFTKQELDEMAEEMDMAMARKSEVEAELDSLQQAAKERKVNVEAIIGDVSRLAAKRRERFEMRPTKCHRTKDFDLGVMEYASVETGEVVKVRPLNNEELQAMLQFEAERAADEDEKAKEQAA